MTSSSPATDLVFYLNGKRVHLAQVDPTVLLADYLRSPEVGLTGTKIGCKQGGCGACTVMLSSWDEDRQQAEHRSVNSCLRPLASLDGMLVTTVEGTGSVKSGCISAVQDGLATNNGTQCGFCTPGWIMNMTAAVAQRGPKPGTKQQIEALFDGNICRCTGYRPILYGFKKTFASDWNPAVDEQGCMSCQVDPAEAVAQTAPVQIDFPAALRKPPRALHYEAHGYQWFRPLTVSSAIGLMRDFHPRADLRLVGGNTSIGIYPRTVEDPHVFVDIAHLPELHALRLADGHLHLGGGLLYGTVVGFLDQAIAEAQAARQPSAIGLQALAYMAGRTAGTIVRNAATLAGNTMLVVTHADQGVPFPSDMYTALAALDASVTVAGAHHPEPRTLPLLELPDYWRDHVGGCMLLSYDLRMTGSDEYAQTYKTAQREVNAHSIVNAGMRVRLDAQQHVAGIILAYGGLAPTAVRMHQTERALAGQQWNAAALARALAVLQEEIDTLIDRHAARYAQLPDEGYSWDYKRQLAASYLYKFFIAACEWRGIPVDPALRSAGERGARPVSRGTQAYRTYRDEFPVNIPYVKIEAMLQATGEAQYIHDIQMPPTGMNGAPVQSMVAKGSCVYRVPGVEGNASPAEVLEALQAVYPSVRDYITAIDVPGPVIDGMGMDDPIFAISVEPSACNNGQLPAGYDARAPLILTGFGQCIGMVVARNEQIAQQAAWHVQTRFCAYTSDLPQIGLPDTDAARNQLVFLDQPPGASWYSHIWKITRSGTNLDWVPPRSPEQPDLAQPVVTRGVQVASSTLGTVSCTRTSSSQQTGSQIHFYMETQSSYIEPVEDRQVRVFASTQDANVVQSSVARVLQLPANKVDVRVRRIGGGYGGKCGQSAFASTTAAVAAWKLNLPVRMAALRQVDTAMFGHRHPALGNYTVAVGDASNPATHGKLLGFQADYWLDGGRTYDCSFIISDCLSLRSDSAYFIPNWACTTDVCRTNTTTNTSMRTVGMIQGAIIVEDAIEAAAHSVGLTPEQVRSRNLYVQGQDTPYAEPLESCYMREVWDYTLQQADFERRAAAVEQFNAANRWRKRGISVLPVKYGSGFNLALLEQGGALIEVYAQDGTVLVRHGGIEMGQGLNTKMAQLVAYSLNVPIGIIRIAENDTAVVPNPESTGASTGTSFNGSAAQQACGDLRRRLEAYCQDLRQQHGQAWCAGNHVNYWDYQEGWRAVIPGQGRTLWQNIVGMAFNARLNLSAQARVAIEGGEHPDGNLEFKLVDGKPASEEVDYFTGYTYSAACVEVELDVLTGETTILRADVVYDGGKCLNPAIDVGQVEGGFVQGLGYVTSEELSYQPADSDPAPSPTRPAPGALYTVNTWEYKPPAAQSIPLEMNIMMFPRELAGGAPEDPGDIMSAKEIGEPPMTLAVAAFFAIKRAVLAARKDRGHDEWFQMASPATVERVRQACLVEPADLTAG
jgi:xanthine dehydrogenase/oxidase